MLFLFVLLLFFSYPSFAGFCLLFSEWMDVPITSGVSVTLMKRLAENALGESIADAQVRQILCRLRIKKQAHSVYLTAMGNLLKNCPGFALIGFRECVASLSRNQAIVGRFMTDCFSLCASEAVQEVARCLQEISYSADSNAIKKLMKKIAKHVELDWLLVCRGLLVERQEVLNQDATSIKNWVHKLAECVCLCATISIPAFARQDKQEHVVAVSKWRCSVSLMQAEAALWCKALVPKYLQTTDPAIYINLLKMILLLDHPSTYFGKRIDARTEKYHYGLITKCLPVAESTLSSIVFIFESLTHLTRSFCNTEGLKIIQCIVFRAFKSPEPVPPSLAISDPRIIEQIMKLCIYPNPINGKTFKTSHSFRLLLLLILTLLLEQSKVQRRACVLLLGTGRRSTSVPSSPHSTSKLSESSLGKMCCR